MNLSTGLIKEKGLYCQTYQDSNASTEFRIRGACKPLGLDKWTAEICLRVKNCFINCLVW